MEPKDYWQIQKKKVIDRNQYLLETNIWSDCQFIVGTKPNQQVIKSHKLLLAKSSPVFEAMFFGEMAEKNSITIQDMQPEVFKDLLKYIYTDNTNLNSIDQAWQLCYAAKKYMFPYLVEECIHSISQNMCPKTVCRAYEFAKFFEAPIFMQTCMNIISTRTSEVLSALTFNDAELSTIISIFDQDELNILSELELFVAFKRYLENKISSEAENDKIDDAPSAEASYMDPAIRNAIKKIRFLTLTPQQFADGPGSSSFLTLSEKFAIFMKMSSSTNFPMPEGFSTSTINRRKYNNNSRMFGIATQQSSLLQPRAPRIFFH